MPKRILLPLDPSPFSDTATLHAIHSAVHHDSEVTAIVIVDKPGIEESVGPFSPGSAPYAARAEDRLEVEALERVQELLARFVAQCDDAAVAHREIVDQGDPAESIAAASAYYDIVVIGLRTYFHFLTSDKPGETLSELIGNLATPILAVPEHYTPVGDQLDVLVAFDGSPASIRSLRQFAQYAAPSNPNVTILTADSDMNVAASLFEPAAAYFKSYGFTDVRSAWTPMDINDAVDEQYLQDAEMIVVGAHSKRGFFDFRVGSLTNHLLHIAEVPVFIGQ